MSNRLFSAICAAVALCLLTASTAWTQEREKTIGQRVDRALEQIHEGAKDVAGQLREGWEKVRATVDRMSVEGRVYARLHWDKALQDASISVDVQKGGVATLRGTVASEAAKTKANELTRDTVGVERVVNDLKVAASKP